MVSYGAALPVLFAAATVPSASAFAPPRQRLSSAASGRGTRRTSVAPPRSTAEDTTGADSDYSSTSRPDQPDYGSTPVDVDAHRLEKIARWRRSVLSGKTLVDQTLEEMKDDSDFRETSERLAKLGQEGMTREERANRRRALDKLGVPDFNDFISFKTEGEVGPALTRRECGVLQINVGLYCNQACGHCHVESSPLRTEMMTAETAARCLELLKNSPSVHTLDVTGGAPELNDSFRYLVSAARELRGGPEKLDIIDRCNLTVLKEPGQEDLVDFLVKHKVHVVASLPCYSAENVDKQRGSGVFDRSVSGLLALNEAGYGVPGTGLELDLVYNPLGAFLPPEQSKLEEKYKEELDDNFGVRFNKLYTMTNMPVKRFADFLHRRDELGEYMDLLVRNFNAGTADSLMCRDTVSVGWDGGVYDCDFNQQLGYGMGTTAGDGCGGGGKTVFDMDTLSELVDVPIRNDNHCFGCTAGMGSS